MTLPEGSALGLFGEWCYNCYVEGTPRHVGRRAHREENRQCSTEGFCWTLGRCARLSFAGQVKKRDPAIGPSVSVRVHLRFLPTTTEIRQCSEGWAKQTAMNRSQIIALYDQDQRVAVEYPDTRREVTPHVVRHVNTSDIGEGSILYSRLDETNVDEVMREQIAYFQSVGQNFEWKLYDYDRPSGLLERLLAVGFEVKEAEAIMVLDLETAPAVLLQPLRHTVVPVTDVGMLEDMMSIERQVWDQDFTDLGRSLAETMANDPERLSVYVAHAGSTPASAAWIYFPAKSRFASLWGGPTLEHYRKQGLYTALLAVRVREAIRRQTGYPTADASPMSRPLLEKFGFEMIAISYPCKWKVAQ